MSDQKRRLLYIVAVRQDLLLWNVPLRNFVRHFALRRRFPLQLHVSFVLHLSFVLLPLRAYLHLLVLLQLFLQLRSMRGGP